MTENEEQPDHEFDLAVSFAGEDREYVSEVVDAVKGEMKVFYDEDYLIEAWGEDGIEFFTNVYLNRAKYVAMFVSHQYADKMWTNIERRSALARAASQRSAYILPVRLDDTQLEGLLPTVIYLDARRLGIDGIISALRSKVSRTPPKPSNALLDGKVPRSQEAIEALMAERNGVWEYLLYAGLLKVNMDELEPKYHDFIMGYAPRNGRHIDRDEFLDFSQRAMASIRAIVDNFNVVLGPAVQERAFGKPGEPGDATRIVHLAEKFIAVYEDFMEWATDLRGTTCRTEGGAESLRALSNWANQPIEECRRFVENLVTEFDTLTERMDAGEHINLTMTVTLELDDAVSADFLRKLKQALEED
ncbi:TIR domain-containing protein [Serinicoccus sp. LYQ131]|uniref:TIR domain-containing protein n=1 Tax=Serinicoccus sp. LYQ131 TaxID=3378797 RepID=UPI0038549FBC